MEPPPSSAFHRFAGGGQASWEGHEYGWTWVPSEVARTLLSLEEPYMDKYVTVFITLSILDCCLHHQVTEKLLDVDVHLSWRYSCIYVKRASTSGFLKQAFPLPHPVVIFRFWDQLHTWDWIETRQPSPRDGRGPGKRLWWYLIIFIKISVLSVRVLLN